MATCESVLVVLPVRNAPAAARATLAHLQGDGAWRVTIIDDTADGALSLPAAVSSTAAYYRRCTPEALANHLHDVVAAAPCRFVLLCEPGRLPCRAQVSEAVARLVEHGGQVACTGLPATADATARLHWALHPGQPGAAVLWESRMLARVLAAAGASSGNPPLLDLLCRAGAAVSPAAVPLTAMLCDGAEPSEAPCHADAARAALGRVLAVGDTPVPAGLVSAWRPRTSLSRSLWRRLVSLLRPRPAQALPPALPSLVAAAAAGDLAGVQQQAEVAAIDGETGAAALAAAAATGHLDIALYLVGRGVPVNAHGGRAIRVAAERGHGQFVNGLHPVGAFCEPSPELRATIDAMAAELQAAPDIYLPSQFWNMLSSVNDMLLGWGGIENFKKSINQNYHNFVPTSLDDPKIATLAATLPGFDGEAAYQLTDPDDDPQLWTSWTENSKIFKTAACPGGRAAGMAIYRRFLALMHSIALAEDRYGTLARAEEPLLGNPIRVTHGGRLVSQDLVNSARERDFLVEALGAEGAPADRRWTVGELGAGYGRLGHMLLSTTPCRYLVFDIPPALCVSQWYLGLMFPERRIFRFRHFDDFAEVREELAAADLAFLTPNQLALLPDDYLDGMATISSLHEMRPEQIGHFLGLMGRKARYALLLKQQYHYVNPFDGLVIERDAYAAPEGWGIRREVKDACNPEFFMLALGRGAGAVQPPVQ